MKITKREREKLSRNVEIVLKMKSVSPEINPEKISTLLKQQSAKKTSSNRILSPKQKEQLNYSYGIET